MFTLRAENPGYGDWPIENSSRSSDQRVIRVDPFHIFHGTRRNLCCFGLHDALAPLSLGVVGSRLVRKWGCPLKPTQRLPKSGRLLGFPLKNRPSWFPLSTELWGAFWLPRKNTTGTLPSEKEEAKQETKRKDKKQKATQQQLKQQNAKTKGTENSIKQEVPSKKRAKRENTHKKQKTKLKKAKRKPRETQVPRLGRAAGLGGALPGPELCCRKGPAGEGDAHLPRMTRGCLCF